MKIMKNKIMEDLLKRLEKYKSPPKTINIELNKLFYNIYPNIIVYNDIIMRKNNRKIDREHIIKNFGSISAFEDFENHIHIVDIVDCSLMQSLKFGIIIKDIIKNKLKSDFPRESFVIVLICDGKNKMNTIIRWHKLRKNEILYDRAMINNICCGYLVEKI
jgi:hypothetical protein